MHFYGAPVNTISTFPPACVRNSAPSIKLLKAWRNAGSSTATCKGSESLLSYTIRYCLWARGLTASTRSANTSETLHGLPDIKKEHKQKEIFKFKTNE